MHLQTLELRLAKTLASCGRGAPNIFHDRAAKRLASASAHVHRLGRAARPLDADHRSQSRSQAAHSAAAAAGQTTLTVVPERCSSIRMSPSTGGAFSDSGRSLTTGMGTSSGAAATGGAGILACLASMTQLRSMFAFRLYAERPQRSTRPASCTHRITAALNSALCRRRRLRPIRSTP